MTRATRRRPVRRNTFGPAVHHNTSIIVPVLNEADNILPLVERVSKAMEGRNSEILFVDDSRDTKTVEAVTLAKKIYRSKTFDVRVYHRTGEKRWGGLSGAVTAGMAFVTSDQVIVMDGDLQHPPETIPSMLAAATTANIVVASRYCKGGSANGLDGHVRHFVSRGSTLLAKIFFPFRLRNVSDPMTGFFLVNRKQIASGRLRPKGFKILLEILAVHPELSVAEVPLKFADRVAGESHGTLKQGLEFFVQLISLRTTQLLRGTNPMAKFIQFGAIGGSVFVLGMALLYTLVEVFSWSPLSANAVQLTVTFWLNYALNRKITWRERAISRLAAFKFVISRAATTVLNYLMFVWLISQHLSFAVFERSFSLSINYLAANVITLTTIMVLNFFISDRWAFAEQTQKPNPTTPMARFINTIPTSVYTAALLAAAANFVVVFGFELTVSALLALASILLFLLSSFEVWRMLYAYRDPESSDLLRFPAPTKPRERFCIIVPARHESAVLAGTLRQLAKQTHPSVDIVNVICDDDIDTLSVAREVEADEPRVTVMTYPLEGRANKPKQLNYAFSRIKDQGYSVIGVVDAEDTVQPDLLMHIDAAFRDREVGIVQGGVQLMNHDSSWYSLHNVLEYYRWFNNAMVFQADNKFMPLGGNTIFIRNNLLEKVGGWPETLTEDCSLGVLLSTRYQTKTAVYYEPHLATREETPDSLGGLFKQRVRWNQGFFHEWRKGIWRDLPTLRQRLLADYILFSPVLLAGISLLLPVSFLAFLFLDAPVGLAMLMNLPLIPISLHLAINALMLHDFGKAFQRKVLLRQYATLFTTQLLYQIVLSTAALWAVVRELRGVNSWYKTTHTGQHRGEPAFAMAGEAPASMMSEVDNA